jgi:hypothetical protein
MSGLLKRLRPKTSSSFPACGKPISVFPSFFWRLEPLLKLQYECPACKANLQKKMRTKGFLFYLLTGCIVGITGSYIHEPFKGGEIAGLIAIGLLLLVGIIYLPGYSFYFKDLRESKNPPSRNQQS